MQGSQGSSQQDYQEVPRESWSRFLTELSHRARDRDTTVRVESLEFGDQMAVSGLPLVGISCEEKGSMADAIEITLGRPDPLVGVTHVVQHPTHLYFEAARDGEVAVLDIEDAEHVKTLITFWPVETPQPMR